MDAGSVAETMQSRAAAQRDPQWGISASLQEAGAIPLSCRAPASPLLLFSPQPNIYQVMREKPWRDQQDHVYVFTGGPYLPDQTKTTPPCLQCSSLQRIWVTFIQITALYSCSSLTTFFFFLTDAGEKVRSGFAANTQLQSTPHCYLSSPSPNETNRPAVREMHCSPAYLRALQCIMFNFYSQRCCDTGLFLADETKPSVYSSSRRASTVQDNRFQDAFFNILILPW